MKQEMFGAATIEAALNGLKKYGAMIPTQTAEMAKEKKADIIIGKFTNSKKCFDGYCIRETPENVIKTLMKEFPNEDLSLFKYNVLICRGCKNDKELLKGLGI